MLSKSALSENPRTLSDAIEGFHGRQIKSVTERDIEGILNLRNYRLLGRSDKIFYRSDKRDPSSPKGDGRQGIAKDFYHTQSPLCLLYVVYRSESDIADMKDMFDLADRDSRLQKKSRQLDIPAEWPEEVGLLGKLTRVEYSVDGEEEELDFVNYNLYCWDDMKTIMAIPDFNAGYSVDKAFIWVGEKTRVNWRGIID